MRKPEKSLNNDYLKVFDLESEAVIDLLKNYIFYHLIIGGGYSNFKDTSALNYCINKVSKLTLRTDSIQDFKSLYMLKNLEEIYFCVPNPFGKDVNFDFNNFPKLKTISVEYWDSWATGILNLIELQNLYLWNYKSDLILLDKLINIKKLNITQSSFSSLNGIASLVNLEDLSLSSIRKIRDLSDLSNMKKLKKISIESMESNEINIIKNIKTLEDITLCKKYSFYNLDLFLNFKNLINLCLYGQIDNYNFEDIFSLKEIKKLTFVNQKSFNLSNEELFNLAEKYNKKIKIDIFGKKNKTVVIYFLA